LIRILFNIIFCLFLKFIKKIHDDNDRMMIAIDWY
jgi:hypothetical protein